MDEAYDLLTVRSGWQGILDAENRFPPLYHFLLRGWLLLAPFDETGRVFSCLCGTALVAIVGLLGREIDDELTGFWAAALCSISPFAVWYSLEARVYSLYLLLAALSLWQFVVALRTDKLRNWFAFSVFSLTGVYTHYYFGILLIITGLHFLALKLTLKRSLKRGLWAFAMIAFFCLPAVGLLRQDLDQPWGYARRSSFSLPALGYSFFSYFSGYSLGPSLRELHTIHTRTAILGLAPWLLALGVAVGFACYCGLRQSNQNAVVSTRTLLMAYGILPVIIVGGMSMVSEFGFNVRHALWSFVPIVVVVAAGIAHGRPKWFLGVCTSILLMTSLLAVYNHHHLDRYRHEDIRAFRQWLDAESLPGLPVFVLSDYMTEVVDYYLAPNQKSIGIETGEAEGNPVDAAIERISTTPSEQGDFLLVYTREFHGDPDGGILAALQGEFNLVLVHQVAGARIYLGKTGLR